MSPAPIGLGGDPLPPQDFWPIVVSVGVSWRVAPVYIAPVSREEAIAAVAELECELPTPDLVDAIWRAADLRLNPHHLTRNWKIAGDLVAYESQARSIEREVLRLLELAGRESFTLLVGSHKDFVVLGNGRVDLYGWHSINGNPLQPRGTSHNEKYKDYSQAVRAVRRIS